MGKVKVGFDAGYGFIKAVFSDEQRFGKLLFPTAIEKGRRVEILKDKHTILQLLQEPLDKVLSFEYDNKVFSVGRGTTISELAVEHTAMLRPIEDMKLLLLAVLGMLQIRYAVDSFDVVYAVPIGLKEEEKERLRNANIKGTHSLKTYGITERTLSFSIDNLLVAEQGITSFIDLIYKIEGENVIVADDVLRNSRTAIIDIGTNTLNTVVIDKMKIITKKSYPKSGMFFFIEDFMEQVKNKGISITRKEVQEMIMNNNFVIETTSPEDFTKKEKKDFTPVAQTLLQSLFANIIKPRVNELLRDYRVEKVVFTGGGALLFEDIKKGDFVIPSDPQFSNALGAWKLLYINRGMPA